ncbi:MAG: ribonuclease Z [Muribaculaceae bacterium]|nr:ribonuclease Z [Muribaculaceae bacterium]
MARLELNILGCGSATTSLRHMPTCQVLNVRDQLFMIDCGEGAQLAMRRMKLKFSRLSHIFISHLHGDHCFGLLGLLSTLALQGKTGSVTVHTFQDGAQWLQQGMDYFCRERPYELKFNIITTRKAVIYEDDAITVTTIPLRHRVPAVGFLFAEKPKMRHIDAEAAKFHKVPLYAYNSLRQGLDWVDADGIVVPNAHLTKPAERAISYAYCSDTMLSRRVIKAVEGVDWLYHEATYGDECQRQARARYHSTATDAATVAHEAGAQQLIIGHFSNRYNDDTPLLEQAQRIFPATRLAYEGLKVDLNEL